MSVTLPTRPSAPLNPVGSLPRVRHLRGLKHSGAEALTRLLSNAPAANVQAREWKAAHRRRVLIVDSILLAVVMAVAQGAGDHVLPVGVASQLNWVKASLISVALACGWLVALELQRSRDISLIGIGAEEYRRVIFATAWLFGLFAVSAILLGVTLPRGQLIIALLLGLIGLLIGRRAVRAHLAYRRRRGEFMTRVVVLGSPESARLLSRSFGRSTETGYRVVGVCIPDFVGEIGDELVTPTGPVPVLGDGRMVTTALDLTGAEALAVAAGEHLGHQKMKELLWQLESAGTELIVVPGVTDVAGPRLLMRPIDNLPLFHIAPPRLDGPSAVAKRFFDIALGAVAMMVAVPVLVLAAVVIKLEDGGPILFRQERVGHRGRRFRIFKLRTMSVGADAWHDAENLARADGRIFYKSACDSRITRVGRFLRVTSIDELPQLLNVLNGSMSVVGPRPLVPGEGESVENFIERRSLVKPGMTGLWQVSGRSDLSEDERVRLDHSYVDNWSCAQDLLIVWRTVRAVLRREGAY